MVGVVGSGKTTFVTTRYAYRALQIWQDDIDFFNAEDMWGTLEAIKISDKKVHFVLIDDSGPLFDCRNPMGNMTATEMYWEIRHELKRYAKQSGRSVGGLVILAIVIQDYMGLDKRIRDALGFTVFKTYDKAIKKEKLIPDEKLQKLLKKLKYKSSVACDWKYRKFAVGVDAEEKYTLFYCDPDQYPYIPFTNVIGEDIFEKQRDFLVKYLVNNIDLEAPREVIQGKLYFEIDKIKKSDERCRISNEHFSEIIKRAKTIKYEENEKLSQIQIGAEKEQIFTRIIKCPNCGNYQSYTQRKSSMPQKKPNTKCKRCGFRIPIDANNSNIITLEQILTQISPTIHS